MIPPNEKIENPYLFLMKYPHSYKMKFTNKSTNWLKAEQLEIQTPLKKKKNKTKQIRNSNRPNLNLKKCGLNNY